MPPILMTPLIKWTMVALGGAVVIHRVVKEARRINEELDRARQARVPIPRHQPLPTLRRDPTTGEYRL